MNSNRKYLSKLLLFGEYGVICDSMGLTVPFNYFSGFFETDSDFSDKEMEASNKSLAAFHAYLTELGSKKELMAKIRLEELGSDISNGLFFNSNIPQGYGVGSSGAVCAAIYDQYATDKISLDENNWSEQVLILKKTFSQMESYFHGTSSGLDPLICYLNEPLHIEGKKTISPTAAKRPSGLGIFLIDTGMTSKTNPLVKLFFDKMRHHSFYKKFNNGFLPANDECILSYLSGETELFCKNVDRLSAFSLELFDPMIPEDFHEAWSIGLQTEKFSLKLCGSGGGGFLLGFTRDLNEADKLLQKAGCQIIPWLERD